MGSWGYGPFDNDDAANMIAELTASIRKAVTVKNDRLASLHYNAARAAIRCLLLSHGTDILGGPALDTAIQALDRIRADKRWIEQWDKPERIRRQLRREVKAVLDVQRKCKGCRERGGALEAGGGARSAGGAAVTKYKVAWDNGASACGRAATRAPGARRALPAATRREG